MELIPSPHKKYQETVVIVPFFGAQRSNLKRHIQYLGELGFDVAAFDLLDHLFTEAPFHFINLNGKLGLKHKWTEQITEILDNLPGSKIIFSFSNPSASAIEAVSLRQARDIRGLICDGGPSGQLRLSMINYFTYAQPIQSNFLRWLAAGLTAFLWHPRFGTVIHDDLRKIPKDFPILSIRGQKDSLISVEMIEMVFSRHSQIALEKLVLAEGEHVNGLKEFPEIYKPAVEKFLLKIATVI